MFLPKIESFVKLIDELEESHETIHECIRKFDEDLSLKENKSYLNMKEKEFE